MARKKAETEDAPEEPVRPGDDPTPTTMGTVVDASAEAPAEPNPALNAEPEPGPHEAAEPPVPEPGPALPPEPALRPAFSEADVAEAVTLFVNLGMLTPNELVIVNLSPDRFREFSAGGETFIVAPGENAIEDGSVLGSKFPRLARLNGKSAAGWAPAALFAQAQAAFLGDDSIVFRERRPDSDPSPEALVSAAKSLKDKK